LENRIRYYPEGERKKWNHHLITRGVDVESVASEVRGMSQSAFRLLLEEIFSLLRGGHYQDYFHSSAFVAVIIIKLLLAHALTSIGQKERRPLWSAWTAGFAPVFFFFLHLFQFGIAKMIASNLLNKGFQWKL